MIEIIVNGKPRQLAGPIGLVEFLETHNISTRMIAVAHNGQILRREDWLHVSLQEADRLEIIHMVGGGASSRERTQEARGTQRALGPSTTRYSVSRWLRWLRL